MARPPPKIARWLSSPELFVVLNNYQSMTTDSTTNLPNPAGLFSLTFPEPDQATSVRVIRGFRLISVVRHGSNPEKGAGLRTAPFETLEGRDILPRGLCHARNHAVRGELAEGDPGETETTEEGTATAGHLTAIHEPGRACVAGEHRQSNIVFLLLQLVTKVSVSRNGLCFALVALNPAFSCHGGGEIGGNLPLARIF